MPAERTIKERDFITMTPPVYVHLSIFITHLDYTITLDDGTSFKVEAEETRGDVCEFHVKPTEWVFSVTLGADEMTT